MAKKGLSKRHSAGKSGKSPAKAKAPASAKKPVAAKKAPARVVAKKKAVSIAKSAPSKTVDKKLPAPVRPAMKVTGKKSSAFARPAPAPPPFVPPPLRPVATNDKPRKNQSGLGARDLEHFRQLLLEKRREIVGDMSSMEREALRNSGGSNLSNLPIHMADMGTDNYEQEFTLGLVEKDRVLLREINTALAKIQDGSYGTCEGTGKPINKVRLEAQPWTRYSIEFARQKERGMIR